MSTVGPVSRSTWPGRALSLVRSPTFLSVLVAMLSAWLYFRPMLPLMAPDAHWPLQATFQALFPSGLAQNFGGGAVDLDGTIWTFETVTRMIDGTGGSTQPGLFYPVGWDQGQAQGFAWLDAITAYPLVKVMGADRFFNLYLFLMLVGSHLACTLLFREAKAPLPIALAFSTVALCNGFFARELAQGRPTQVHLIFLALFLRHALRLVRPEGRAVRDGLIAGAMLAASGYVYWFSAIPVGFTAAFGVLLALACNPQRWRVAIPGGLILAVSAVLLVIVPTWRVSERLFFGDASSIISTLDNTPMKMIKLGFLTIPVRGWNITLRSWSGLPEVIMGFGLPGITLVIGLLALLVPLGWRRTAPWAVAGLLASTYPVGHAMLIDDQVYPTAFGLSELLVPALVRCHVTERTLVAPMLVLLLAGALAAGELSERSRAWPLRLAAWVTGGLIFVNVAMKLQLPFLNTSAFTMPPVYTAIAEQVPGGIIDVPISESSRSYVFQIFHHQPLLGGPGITGPNTQPAEHRTYCQNNSFLVALEAVAAGRGLSGWSVADRDLLYRDGFRTVILHLQVMRVSLPNFVPLLGGDYAQVDPVTAVFKLPAPEGG